MQGNYQNIKIETKIYEEIYKILGWKSYKHSKYNYRVLTTDGIIPIIVNRKTLVKLQENVVVHDPSMITFRPYKNGRQCQFLVDKLMEEEEIKKISIFREKQDNGKYLYSGLIIQEGTEEVMLQEDECKTETEAKFRLFFSWYFGDQYKEDIDLMISEEERFKKEKEEQKKQEEENTKK